MTEAISAVNDFAFHSLGIESFFVCNVATNEASRRVKQKTGAEFVGYIELLHHDGQSRSEKWKVTRGNWLKQRFSEPDLKTGLDGVSGVTGQALPASFTKPGRFRKREAGLGHSVTIASAIRSVRSRHGQHSIDLYFETGFSPCE